MSRRSSLRFVGFRQFLSELCPFLDLEYRKKSVFRIFFRHALRYWPEISHMNRASLKGVHSTFEIFKMAAISKWPPFLTITILPDFSEMD